MTSLLSSRRVYVITNYIGQLLICFLFVEYSSWFFKGFLFLSTYFFILNVYIILFSDSLKTKETKVSSKILFLLINTVFLYFLSDKFESIEKFYFVTESKDFVKILPLILLLLTSIISNIRNRI